MTAQETISVIIIVKNEAHRIKRCLDSIAWANEIVILDSGSSDNTVEICKEYTNKVYETDWPGFGVQKNRALEKATGDWVLSIDADEWLSDELIAEIKQTISAKEAEGIFAMPRKTKYIGQWICHGDGGKDSVVRLFKRGVTRFTDDVVHESLQTKNCKVGMLKNTLLHDSYGSVEELIEKMNTYSSLSAKIRHEKRKPASLTKAIVHGAWAFFRAYILRAGFLDGRIGFIVAVSSAESSYYRYLKLIYLNKEKK